MTALIKAEGLCKRYVLPRSSVDVLRGASISIQPGETVAITGSSGAGKSTLLHILGGLDAPDSGRVIFGGSDLYKIGSGARSIIRSARVGFVFQSYHLLPEMDVIENVMVPALARPGIAGCADIRGRANELLGFVGLEDRAGHTPMELSGGECQRVALARALMNNPDIVLADEPTGNLDAVTGQQVLKYLFSLIRGKNHSMILVTHNMDIARSCDRVLELKSGILYPGK